MFLVTSQSMLAVYENKRHRIFFLYLWSLRHKLIRFSYELFTLMVNVIIYLPNVFYRSQYKHRHLKNMSYQFLPTSKKINLFDVYNDENITLWCHYTFQALRLTVEIQTLFVLYLKSKWILCKFMYMYYRMGVYAAVSDLRNSMDYLEWFS